METELESIKNAIKQIESNQNKILSDIHSRLHNLEKPKNIGHSFYNKNSDGSWMVKCFKTGGTFSTSLWKNEQVQKNTCPCCEESIVRNK